jgi:hypothetical protein
MKRSLRWFVWAMSIEAKMRIRFKEEDTEESCMDIDMRC